MSRPKKLADSALESWLESNSAWKKKGDALTRSFKFKDFGDALAFVVRVGLHAEKNDHHPDITLGWGKATVLWTTHDAGGVTTLDTMLAQATDAAFVFA
jgi:4a-hydroxytetrahydrobiopterin dehydratase